MAREDDLIGPPKPVRAQGLPIEPKQRQPVQAGVGGRPSGGTTAAAPSAAPPGPTGQAMTPLGAPAPSPSRPGLAAGDSREPELKPGEQPAATGVEAQPKAEPEKPAAPGLQEAQPQVAPAPSAGGVPGLVVEPQLPEVTMTRDLHRDEWDKVTPGVYNTPGGTIRRDMNGEVKILSLSPALLAAKKNFEVKVLKEKFGSYPGMEDPNSPKPTIEAGKRFFNPFTGQWGIAEPGQ